MIYERNDHYQTNYLHHYYAYHAIFPSPLIAISILIRHHSLPVDLVVLKITIIDIPRYEP